MLFLENEICILLLTEKCLPVCVCVSVCADIYAIRSVSSYILARISLYHGS